MQQLHITAMFLNLNDVLATYQPPTDSKSLQRNISTNILTYSAVSLPVLLPTPDISTWHPWVLYVYSSMGPFRGDNEQAFYRHMPCGVIINLRGSWEEVPATGESGEGFALLHVGSPQLSWICSCLIHLLSLSSFSSPAFLPDACFIKTRHSLPIRIHAHLFLSFLNT